MEKGEKAAKMSVSDEELTRAATANMTRFLRLKQKPEEAWKTKLVFPAPVP